MAKGHKASLGCLFWIAIILLAVVLFILNQNNIMQFLSRFQTKDGKITLLPSASPPPAASSPRPSPSPDPVDPIVTIPPTASPEILAPTSTPVAPSPSPTPVAIKKNVRNSKLYFITRKNNDTIDLTTVSRSVTHDNAPLTETLQVLLKGPTQAEQRSSIMSLIPAGARLKDVYVKGDTAYISFNEEFRFNAFGVPGLQAQVKQVVYTATEFPNIGKVQILIEGKKVNYLAQEGVFIGAPLSRSSF